MEELKKCPLCDGESDCYRHGVHTEWWYAECRNNNCAIKICRKTKAEVITAWNTRPNEWDLKEWPVQTHLRSKTMDEHIEKIKCLFGDELSPFIKITPTTKMPEKDTGDFFNVITDGDVEVCFYDGDWDCPNIGYLKNVTHYQKITLPEE